MTTGQRKRVLVVDDSAFARKVLREVLSADPRLEVVGFARNGMDALEKIDELNPDIVTLDLVMPELDGVGVLAALSVKPNPPRVVVVTMTEANSTLGLAALEAGAFDIVQKPTALATDRLYEIERDLIDKVAAAGREPPRREQVTKVAAAVVQRESKVRLVVIGTSTGGPRALTDLLNALPADFPAPIAAVVHMPVGYTDAFAARINASSPLKVIEATEGGVLRPGMACIAPGGLQLRIKKRPDGLVTTLSRESAPGSHCPSVDVLFESAAAELEGSVLGVVLTGMGSDGLLGARAIRKAGGALLVEAESSCVVYGMPRVVAEDGLDAAVIPLEKMAQAIADRT